MPQSLETLVSEFERLSLDDRIYMTFKSEEELGVAVQFERRADGRCWSVWYLEAAQASKQMCSRSHLEPVLRAFRVSDAAVHEALSNKLLTQAAFADEFVREVTQIMGEEAVRASIRSTQDFMDALRDAVKGLFPEESSSHPNTPSPTNSAGPTGPAGPAHPRKSDKEGAESPTSSNGGKPRGGLRIIRS